MELLSIFGHRLLYRNKLVNKIQENYNVHTCCTVTYALHRIQSADLSDDSLIMLHSILAELCPFNYILKHIVGVYFSET